MTSHRRSESGFTLVEMLIAMAVMSLVIVAFYALITTLVRQWASMQGQMEVQQQPRVAAGRIMAEIRQSRDFVIGSGGKSLRPGKATVLPPDASGGVVQPLGAIFTLAGTRVTRNGTILSAAASSGATSVSVVLGSVFAAGDIVAVGSEAPVTVSSVSGNTLTITPALASAHSSGEVVATVLADVTNPVSLQLFSVVSSTLSSSAAVGAKSLCVASVTGFNVNDRVQVDRETYDTTTGLVTQPNRANITSIGGGCLTVDWGLNTSRAVGVIVRVNAISVNLMTSQVNANQQTQQVNLTSKATPRN